jgi:branched-chain amino acid transport system substrate-binding protein
MDPGMKTAFALLFSLITLSACDKAPIAQQRAERMASTQGDITVAVAYPLKSSKSTVVNGIQLAADEINAGGGAMEGRKIKLLLRDDAGSLNTGRQVAQEISNNIDVAAVIGHLNTYITAPASLIYERAGLLMITPGASGQKVTEQGSQLVFRTLASNRDQARQIGDYATAQGYKRVAIYYIKNDYGVDLANCFEQRARELGITVVDRRSYDMSGAEHSTTLQNWATFLKLDAIFLVGSLPESGAIMREMRGAGLNVPVFGGAGLDSPDLIRLGGASVKGVVVFSLFNLNDPRPEVLSFRQRYEARYGRLPDATAAQGYDTLKLLVHAMNSAHSAVPAKVAAALRTVKGWSGVTGVHTFDAKGDLVAKPLAKVVVSGDKFVYFPTTPPVHYAP